MENEQGIVKYNITDAAIQTMEKKYMPLIVRDVDDKDGFKAVHEARIVVRDKRNEVEKRRKELKAEALAWGRKVDTEAKRIFGKLKPIEDHLQEQEAIVVEEKKRRKREKEEAERRRVQAMYEELAKYGKVMAFDEVASLSDVEYTTLLVQAKNEHARAEAEKKRQEKEREEFEKKRKAQEEKERKLREEQERLEAEKRRIEEEKRKEQERKEREEFERKAKEEAQKEAERKAKEEAERKEAERIRKEKEAEEERQRQEALRPDKHKIAAYFESLLSIPEPELKDGKLQEWLNGAVGQITDVVDSLRQQVGKL